jgi:uroporphyrinogen decarboxylase
MGAYLIFCFLFPTVPSFLCAMLQNDIFLKAAKNQQTDRTPVWLMRQAGRILPEYRKVREQAGDFKTLVTPRN